MISGGGRTRWLAALAALIATALPSHAAPPLSDAQRALLTARAEAAAAARRSQALEARARQASAAADRARARRAALTERIAEAQATVDAARARMAIIGRLRAAQAKRLAGERAPVIRLTAALQGMARQPPAALLVRPGSVREAVHLRMVLGSVLPVIETRTARLRADLRQSAALEANAKLAAETLHAAVTTLDQRRQLLAREEAGQRRAALAYSADASREAERALAMGETARDLIDRMAADEDAAAVRAALLALPGPAPAPDARSEPLDPVYRLPVTGTLVAGLGEASESGARSRGLTLAPAPNADVVAPAAGRVVFAGPYRSYGAVVIIDHGEGWMTLVAGMARTVVAVDSAVAAGETIGAAPARDPEVTVELRRNGRPMDILALVG